VHPERSVERSTEDAPEPMIRFRGTLAARVALLATIAVGLSVAFVAGAAYVTVKHQLTSSLDSSLLDRARGVAESGTVSRLLGGDDFFWTAADIRLLVANADGTVIAQTEGNRFAPSQEDLQVARGAIGHSSRTVYNSGEPFRAIGVRGDQPGTVVVLAQSLEPTHEALSRLGVILTLFGIVGVGAAGVAGWLVARNGLSPVRRLSGAVEEIARTQRLEPIPIEGNDEVATLASAFNRTLAALAASRDRQRQLVADAGHELRTPLTSLRTNLDLLTQAEARGGLSEQARAELMDDVRFQIEELTTLIGDLTELAREELIPAQLEPVDLSDVVSHALERVRRRASSLHFDVELEPWAVTGEPVALERAVTNLLDNAAKWSPPLGVVTVRLEAGVLYVADQGKGIAPEDLPHVFERFYRSTESRTMPGSGLGLSIVRAVADRHGGQVRAGHAPGGGAAFWFWVPPSAADSHQP
jgi:two-component system, OmpR family, sensor histidine kinase MprB